VREAADGGAGQQEDAGLGGDEEALVLDVREAGAEVVEAQRPERVGAGEQPVQDGPQGEEAERAAADEGGGEQAEGGAVADGGGHGVGPLALAGPAQHVGEGGVQPPVAGHPAAVGGHRQEPPGGQSEADAEGDGEVAGGGRELGAAVVRAGGRLRRRAGRR
jgi:hypothetical protein